MLALRYCCCLLLKTLIRGMPFACLSRRDLSPARLILRCFRRHKTSYPSDLSFARYPDCKARLDDIENTARNTPWFVWAKVARRAISLLQEQSIVSRDHIGVLGFGIGAQLSWMVTGTDKRVCAMCAVNGGGYRWAEHNARFWEAIFRPVTYNLPIRRA